MSPVHCPDAETLEAFSTGQLGTLDWDDVAEHVTACSACQDLLDTLHRETGTLMRLARLVKDRPSLLDDDECRKAVERFQQIVLADEPPLGDLPDLPATEIGTESQSTPPPGSSDSIELAAPLQLGPYRIEEPIGRGGMGHVYRAIHTKLDKPVALKILKLNSPDSRELIERFQREMKAVGRLEHPNLVRATDAGEEGGGHYLTMELIEGSDLAALVREKGPFPVQSACDVIRQAAIGLHSIHEQGLVHRDVKPSNLMLTLDGQVKVLDLGLALLTEVHDSDLTGLGQMMGTLAYMAPEQADDSHHVDRRTDIYSLGCTLYYLLVGREPYALQKPASPLKHAMAHAQAPIPDVTKERPEVPASLAKLLQQCLAKQPAQRPNTALDMAKALEAVTGDENREVEKANESEIKSDARKPKRRGAVGYFLLLGCLGGLISLAITLISIRTEHGTLYLELSGLNARDVQVKINEEYVAVEPGDNGRRLKLSVPPGRHDLHVEYEGLSIKTEQNQFEIAAGKERTIRVWYESNRPTGEKPKVGSATAEKLPPSSPARDSPSDNPVSFQGLNRDDIPTRELALLGGGDPQNAPEELVGMIGDSRFKQPSLVKVAYSPDGRQIATMDVDGSVVVWDAETGMPIRTIATPGRPDWCELFNIDFTADGRRLVTLMDAPRLWRLADGNHLHVYGDGSRSMDLSRDGRLIGHSPRLGQIVVAELETGKEVFSCRPKRAHANAMTFGLDGDRVAAGYSDGTVSVWSREAEAELHRLDAGEGKIVDIAISPDRQLIASCAIQDRTVHVWDLKTGKLVRALEGTHGYMRAVDFSPDGKILAASGASRIRLWQTTNWMQSTYAAESYLGDFAFSPDGSQITYTGRAGLTSIETKTKKPLKKPVSVEILADVRVENEGEFWLYGWREEFPRILFIRKHGESNKPKFHHPAINVYLDSPASVSNLIHSKNQIVALDNDKHLKVWEIDTEKEVYAFPWDHAKHEIAAIEPGGEKLAIGFKDGRLAMIDLLAGKQIGIVPAHNESVQKLVFADSDMLISTDGASVKIWDADWTRPPDIITEQPAGALAVSRNGDFFSFVQGSTRDHRIHGPYELCIYERETRKRIGVIKPDFLPKASSVSSDGQIVAASARDGRLAVWDVESQTPLHSWKLPFPCRPKFTPDGQFLLTVNGNGTAYVFHVSQ